MLVASGYTHYSRSMTDPDDSGTPPVLPPQKPQETPKSSQVGSRVILPVTLFIIAGFCVIGGLGLSMFSEFTNQRDIFSGAQVLCATLLEFAKSENQ